jgi:2-dehydro-3-deoxygalactonokinase
MIAIDWGTSSFRAYRLGPDGAVMDKRSAALGILAVKDGAFAQALESQIADWIQDDADILMSGMIGSRQGWQEAPYAICPAGLTEVASAMVSVTWGGGRTAWITPGLAYRDESGVADVMRGEEVQILGVVDDLPRELSWICLPGTHSKWARVEGGRVINFSTYMTGEVFAVMKAHSILGRMITTANHDQAAFDEGLCRARAGGGLLHHLFGVRTRGLFAELAQEKAASYLSGVLIGHELRAVPLRAGAPIHVLGSQELADLYSHAMRVFQYQPQLLDPDAVARGLFKLAQARKEGSI